MKNARWMAVCVAGLLLAACGGDSTGPLTRALRTGRYEIRTSNTIGEWFGARSYSGTMTVTGATEDNVTVRWAVPNWDPTPPLAGGWNADAYLVYAKTSENATINHRMARAGDAVTCGGVMYAVMQGTLRSTSISCVVTYVGP